MADVDRRDGGGGRYNGGGGGGGGGGGYGRKRRYNDDDEGDRPRRDDYRPQRRRYGEEPPSVRVRKQILGIAESPLRDVVEDCAAIAKNINDSWEDERFREIISDNVVQLVTEQPLKIPFVASIILYANEQKADIAKIIIDKAGRRLQETLEAAEWRSFKLILRFLAYMQGLFEGEGVMPLLDDLFNKAADLQTESNDDALGLEFVKIIMLTIPYMLITSTEETKRQAVELLGKTEIIALAPLEAESMVAPYTAVGNEDIPQAQGVINLLQKQLQAEADAGWPLVFIPRMFKPSSDLMEIEGATSTSKHAFPTITIPQAVQPGLNPPFPEVYFSLYADQDIETVPATSNLAASLMRDASVDTIDALPFNRHVAAKFLIDLDCYWAPNTFVKRATPFDKVKDLANDGKSTWKPEDLAVDAVFSLIFRLPAPEHKLIYYHSIITETCKIAPGSIAPSLGRAIRYLYKNIDIMDVELVQRFVDWFSHHLSNFDFRWKWTEWVDDVTLPALHPKKAFILGGIEKEMRLSFAKRVRDTLPPAYHVLIPASKDNEIPDFKYNDETTPHSAEAKKLIPLLKKKAPDADIETVLKAISDLETANAAADPSLAATDAFVTAICYIGSKSLSHVLSYIERCKDRLTSIGHSSPSSRAQIISSVVAFWRDVQAGVAVNIVDKLLNYTILTPSSVIQWALDAERIDGGRLLAETWIYEMVDRTMNKVVGRVRQVCAGRMQILPPEQAEVYDQALKEEVKAMRELFQEVDDALAGVADGASTGMLEEMDTTAGDGVQAEVELARQWGVKWRRVWQRRQKVEETRLREAEKVFPEPRADEIKEEEMKDGNGAAEENAGEDDIM